MPRQITLSSLVDWSHKILADVLLPGDLAVDLTAGNGSDTLFLAETVGRDGLVLAFDIQSRALARTAARLENSGITSILHRGRRPPDPAAGVVLVADGHESVADYLPGPAKAWIANLGFLPGGNKEKTTVPQTTFTAVESALANITPGGRLAVVVYVGHPGGREEGTQLEMLLSDLAPGDWETIRIGTINRQLAPYLVVVERR